jgi:hypothetical protein
MITPNQGLDMEALEGILDRHGLHGVLDMLASVCAEKAEHVRSNWQDEGTARMWDRRATKLSNFASLQG